MKKVVRVLIGILIAAGVIFGGAAAGYYFLNRPVSPDLSPEEAEQYRFTVKNGATVSSVARELEENRHIRSARFLTLVAQLRDLESSIQTGVYQLTGTETATGILDILVSGNQMLMKVTIPEGYTLSKIAQKMADNEICSVDEFLEAGKSEDLLEDFNIPATSFEGYLFPDTYHFPPYFGAENAVRAMADNFFRQLEKIVTDGESESETDGMTREELHKKVILASIVEREYRVAHEAPLIASVFNNRLDINMGLGSCATIEYIITEIEGREHPGFLTYDDLKIDSPYNTYLWAGLPPGPICSPGGVALRAAVYPADTDYWYFVLKDSGSGEHYFSSSVIEHNQAKRLYLKQ